MRQIMSLLIAAVVGTAGCQYFLPGEDGDLPTAGPSTTPMDPTAAPTLPVPTTGPGRPSPTIEIPPPID